ncbi:hypothetical protein F4779DRAFT_409564 [Xylariaceae sp. FL0662B]|nr:hypothetical protein F4779DRAFT_409564 [Xylariaceae sp. FL0662B]
MSAKLRPLRLPLLIEERRKKEEQEEVVKAKAKAKVSAPAHGEAEVEVPYNFYTTDSYSSDTTSPVTPTFSTRGHLRGSSSLSSFELGTPASSVDNSPSSPSRTAQNSGKRILHDVEEEPVECEDSDPEEDDPFDLYDCLCDEPCAHRDADLVRSASNFYSQGRDADYEIASLSDGDFSWSPRLPKKRSGSESHFMGGFTHHFGSRLPFWTKWKSSKPSSIISSPVSDFGFEQRPVLSRAASSSSSSLSASGRRPSDRAYEPLGPPTPALSFFGSSESIITQPRSLDVDRANDLLSSVASIEQHRKQATTPLLPPMMTCASTDQDSLQSSPLESPTVVSPFGAAPHSPAVLSPPLSAQPSHSSLRPVHTSVELPQLPAPDAWSDRLGHANYTIVPKPYKPETADLASLRRLRADWETARVNYTKHLARTGEHYGQTSKTYALTEAKWAETQQTWRYLHDEMVELVVASGEAIVCEKFDESGFTTVPRMDAEGKFPERGDEDIVGPMVRQATMSSIESMNPRRPSFWRSLTGRISSRK